MNPQVSLIHDGKKFMWDGRVYETSDEASAARDAYQRDNFEVHTRTEDDKHFVYTRRVVKEVVPTP